MAPKPTKSRFESEGGLEPRDADHRGRILIVYANQERHTRAIGDALALRLGHHGFAVEIGDPRTGTMPPPQDYDVVVLGVPMTFGRDSALVARYVDCNRAGLSEVPSALFAVSKTDTIGKGNSDSFLRHFLRGVGWQPDLAAAFSDTSSIDVGCFADAIAAALANAAVSAGRSEPHAFGEHP